MVLPAPAKVRGLSALIGADDRFNTSPGDDPALEELILSSAATVTSLTARDVGLDVVGTDTAMGCKIEAVPDWLLSLADRAVVFVAEGMATATLLESREDATEAGISSFTAGPYSESYWQPGQIASEKALSPDPATHSLLWSLATSCAQSYWTFRWQGSFPPGAAAQEFDYGLRGRVRALAGERAFRGFRY